MMTRFSASAWSTAMIEFSRDTDSGTMMNGKITRSFNGRTGSTSGNLIASSFAVSFASVMSYLGRTLGLPCNGDSTRHRPLLQSMQLFHKRIHIFESAIHRSESDVRHGVEIAQAIHHQRAEALRRDLALPGLLHLVLERVGDALQLRLRHRPFAAGDPQSAHQFAAVVRLAALVALHHLERLGLDFFVAGEAALAARALAAPANHFALATLARIDHTILEISAEWTPHLRRPYITSVTPRASRRASGVPRGARAFRR